MKACARFEARVNYRNRAFIVCDRKHLVFESEYSRDAYWCTQCRIGGADCVRNMKYEEGKQHDGESDGRDDA